MIKLPGYNIEKQLGRGGMARVYLARHIGLDKVFDRYLHLAVEEAKDDDFDDAAEYFIAAQKLRPNDNKIKTVGRKIENLQNR